MVEQDHPVVEGEREVGQAAIVGRGVGQVLGVADGVVSGIADRAAGEPRQPRQGDGAIALDQLLEIEERVARGEPAGRPRLGRSR